MNVESKEDYIAQFDAFSSNGAASDPEWLKSLREDAMAVFREKGFPSSKKEEWRFTNVKGLTERKFSRTSKPGDIGGHQVDAYSVNAGNGRLVFVDGIFAPEYSVSEMTDGVQIINFRTALEEIPEVVKKHLGSRADSKENPFVALNTAFLSDGAVVHLEKNANLDRPIEVVFLSSGKEGTISHPRILVVAEENSSGGVVEIYAGPDGSSYFTNAVTEVVVADNARVDFCRIQREGDQAFQVATTESIQGRDSWYGMTPVVLGGRIGRHDIRMTLDGEGGEGLLNGLYMMEGEQHIDHQTVVEHAKPHCESHEYFNGILDDKSRAVFNGRIIVRPGAQKTDSKQTNNNMLLSEDARADSQPQLEIYADDVKCTHGATLGPIDQDALFYLQSRGVPKDSALQMLTYGFGVEILNRVQNVVIKEHLDRLVKGWLVERNVSKVPVEA